MSKTTREDLVLLARDMFRDQGYAGFSMGDLAEQAGIRKASLYSRFTGKDDLAREALLLTLAELAAIALEEGDTKTRYRSLLDGIADHLVTARRCIGLHLLYGGTAEIAPANRAFFADLSRLCETALGDALPPETARQLAEDSLSALEGATLWLILRGDAAPMQRAIESLMMTLDVLIGPSDADLPDPAEAKAVRRILSRYAPETRSGSAAETALAAEIARLEDDLLTVRAALAGQIAAESCFL